MKTAAKKKPAPVAPALYWNTYHERLRTLGYDPVPLHFGEKRPIGNDWTTRDTSRERYPSKRHPKGAGVGERSKNTAGVDADIDNPALVEIVLGVIREFVGNGRNPPAVLRRVGNPPKVLVPFRLEGKPFRKRVHYLDPKNTGKGAPKIEILADGQQWVAYQVHPDTHRDYQWLDGELFDTPREHLPALDEEGADRLLAAIIAALPAAPTALPAASPQRAAPFMPTSYDPLSNLLWPETRAKIAECLDALGQQDANDYDRWEQVGSIIHYESRAAAEGLALWDEWSRRGQKHNDGKPGHSCAEKWTTFHLPVTPEEAEKFLKVGTLITWAREAAKQHALKLGVPTVVEAVAATLEPVAVIGFADFIRDVLPPRWVVACIIARGYVYALTGLWGHGKTALMLTLAVHIAAGHELNGHKIERTKVLYLAGENPNDVRLRALATADMFGIKREELEGWLFFTGRAFPMNVNGDDARLAERARQVAAQAKGLGIGLVVVDTGIAHSATEDENSNAQMHKFAMALRSLMREAGDPAVVALMHPTKDAERNTLTARGGGAFLGEIDSELLAWQQGGAVELYPSLKLRGPRFAPLWFKIEPVKLALKDNFGEPVMSVVAVPTAAGAFIELPKASATAQWALLRVFADALYLLPQSAPVPWARLEAEWAKHKKATALKKDDRRLLKSYVEALGRLKLIDYRDIGTEQGAVWAGERWAAAREAKAV